MTDDNTLPQEQIDRLLSVFMSGFASGMTTLLMSRLDASLRDAPLSAEAKESVAITAQVFSAAILDDPAVRHELGCDLVQLWTHGTAGGVKVMTAHIGTPGGVQG